MLFALAGCGKNNASDKVGQEETSAQTEGENIVKAQITMENGGVIDLELYPDIAPITVENFKSLCEEGFYDGLTFHRIISGFMIQGGDPEGNGTGGPGYSIKGEFELNGVQNDLKHERGVISMARSQNYDSAGSQFFIMHEDADYLDGSYAAFGRVVDGMDVVDEIAATPVSYDGSTPLEAPVIESIKIIED
jgi:peptidyl-prolyl cis-trans isomerase B (cyclophilin B)